MKTKYNIGDTIYVMCSDDNQFEVVAYTVDSIVIENEYMLGGCGCTPVIKYVINDKFRVSERNAYDLEEIKDKINCWLDER